jgi:hypothetical protein
LTLSDSATTSSVNLIIDNDKEIRFNEATANGSNYVSLSAPTSLASNVSFTLPSADGTNGQALITNGSGTLSFSTISTSLTTPLTVVGNSTAGSEIRLPEDTDNGSNYVALKSPDSLASNLTLTLPSADGSSGQVLQTNGSGVLSFAGVSASAGQVIQVVTATDSTLRETTGSSYVTGSNTLSVAITPSSSANKVFIIVHLNSCHNSTNGVFGYFTIFRNATNLSPDGNGLCTTGISMDASVVTPHAGFPLTMTYLDTPNTTSSTTYQVYFKSEFGGNTGFNRRKTSQCRITCMEIAG